MSGDRDLNSGAESSVKQTKCPKCGHVFSSDDKNHTEKKVEYKEKNIGLNSTSERREYKRIKKQSLVRLNDKMALLIDISEGGMLLGTYELPADPEVNIEIKIRENSFKLKGIIRWIREKDSFSGLHSVGIMLKDQPEKFRKLMHSIVEQE